MCWPAGSRDTRAPKLWPFRPDDPGLQLHGRKRTTRHTVSSIKTTEVQTAMATLAAVSSSASVLRACEASRVEGMAVVGGLISAGHTTSAYWPKPQNRQFLWAPPALQPTPAPGCEQVGSQ